MTQSLEPQSHAKKKYAYITSAIWFWPCYYLCNIVQPFNVASVEIVELKMTRISGLFTYYLLTGDLPCAKATLISEKLDIIQAYQRFSINVRV